MNKWKTILLYKLLQEHRDMVTRLKILLLLPLLHFASQIHAELVTGKDEMARLPFWEWKNDYMSLRLVQRLPDQTRAYFAGRGFGKNDVSDIAGHCFFQTVYKNISGPDKKRVIEHDIRDWRYHYKGKSYRMKPREEWKPIWQKRKVGQAQIVAYEWSLFPSMQKFESGDYNWGMSVFFLPHGAKFDLDIAWVVDGKSQSTRIEGITCAKDIYIPPDKE